MPLPTSSDASKSPGVRGWFKTLKQRLNNPPPTHNSVKQLTSVWKRQAEQDLQAREKQGEETREMLSAVKKRADARWQYEEEGTEESLLGVYTSERLYPTRRDRRRHHLTYSYELPQQPAELHGSSRPRDSGRLSELEGGSSVVIGSITGGGGGVVYELMGSVPIVLVRQKDQVSQGTPLDLEWPRAVSLARDEDWEKKVQGWEPECRDFGRIEWTMNRRPIKFRDQAGRLYGIGL